VCIKWIISSLDKRGRGDHMNKYPLKIQRKNE
jgi:hypothetical protein